MLSAKAKEYLKTLGINVEKLDSTKIQSIVKSLTTLETSISSKEEVDAIEFSKLDTSTLKELGIGAKDFGWHTPEDLEEAKKNTKKGAEESVLEITAKKLKDEYGIKADTKDINEVIKAINAHEANKAVEAAKIPIDEQIKLKEKDIELLRTSVLTKDEEILKVKGEAEKIKTSYELMIENNEFASLLPSTYNPLLKPQDYRQRLLDEKGILSKKIDGVFVACNPDGTPIKDTLAKNIPLKAKIDEIFAATPEWNKVIVPKKDDNNEGGFGSGGNGGGGNGGGDGTKSFENIKSMTQLKEYFRSEKIPAGQKQSEIYNKVVIENKDTFNPNA